MFTCWESPSDQTDMVCKGSDGEMSHKADDLSEFDLCFRGDGLNWRATTTQLRPVLCLKYCQLTAVLPLGGCDYDLGQN